MTGKEISEELSRIDDLLSWSEYISEIDTSLRKEAFKLAEPLWVERMFRKGKLLLHPDISEDLKSRGWQPNDTHRKMIWASILVSLDEGDTKAKFREIKAKLIKKHGNNWWFDVYNRVKPTFAAKRRIAKKCHNLTPGLEALSTRTILGKQMIDDERNRALKMLPNK